MSQSNLILGKFIKIWQNHFEPPEPKKSKDGKRNNISGKWSKHLTEWLNTHFGFVIYECHFPAWQANKTRLDAAVWLNKESPVGVMDIAIEWEWNNSSVRKSFSKGDLKKILSAPAKAGIAIIQTRVDAKKGSTEKKEKLANEIISDIRKTCKSHFENNKDAHPVGVIEVRRVSDDGNSVEFKCFYHDMMSGTQRELQSFNYSQKTKTGRGTSKSVDERTI